MNNLIDQEAQTMNFLQGFLIQFRSQWRLLSVMYGSVLVLFLLVGLLSALVPSLTIYDLVGDVTDIGDLPFYAGAISQLGILLWCAAATVCWFSYLSMQKWGVGGPEARRLLLWAAIFTTTLLLDDIYLIHDEVASDYLGFPEKLILLGYLALGVAFVFLNKGEILRSEYGLLVLALGFLGASIAFDVIPRELYEDIYVLEKFEKLFEDGCKFAGILTWLVYFVRYSFMQLTNLVGSAQVEI